MLLLIAVLPLGHTGLFHLQYLVGIHATAQNPAPRRNDFWEILFCWVAGLGNMFE